MLASVSEIEYFIELFKTRHISKSAIRLGITQPALTLSLQKLEEKLGVRLFHRTKQGVLATEQGNLFYKQAHLLLESWEDIHNCVRHSTVDISGRFKLGCHPSVAAYTLPKFLRHLAEETPGIEVDLHHDLSRKITEKIISYNLDLGFVVNPFRHPDLILKKIGTDKVLFWKSKSFEEFPKRIFGDLNLLQIQDMMMKLEKDRFKNWKFVNTSSLELIRTLTLSSQGIGILPERVAKIDGADLLPVDLNLPFFHDEIYLAYRRETLSSRAGKELIRLASHFI